MDLAFDTAQRMLLESSRSGALHAAKDLVVRGPLGSVDFWKRVVEYLEVLPISRARLNSFQVFHGDSEKKCAACGREFDKRAWEKLPLLSYWVIPSDPEDSFLGEVYELKNCDCGGTMAERQLFTGADVERGVAVELPKSGDVVRAQQVAIENLKRDPGFYG